MSKDAAEKIQDLYTKIINLAKKNNVSPYLIIQDFVFEISRNYSSDIKKGKTNE